MAKPIEGIPVFKGPAAAWLDEYLDNAKPASKKVRADAAFDLEVRKRVVPLAELRALNAKRPTT